MNFVENSVSRILSFPAPLIYAIVSDFSEHHLRIAPTSVRNLSYRIIQGGVGKGTIVEFESSIGHEPQPLTYHIDEPEPGRFLTMTTTTGAIVQTFKVDDAALGQCQVTLSIRFRQRSGLRGLIDKVAGPMEIERILEQKMENLELYAATLGATIRGSDRLRDMLYRP